MSETMSKWELWGAILKILEEVGDRRFDPSLVDTFDVLKKSRGQKVLDQVKNESFRILKGMASGEAPVVIALGMARDVLDVFRRFISKGKLRTTAVVRELRQKINVPRRAKNIADYGAAVADWYAQLAIFVSHRGQGTFFSQEDLLEVYYGSAGK